MKKRQGAARSRNQRGTLGQLSKSTQEEDSDGDDIMMQGKSTFFFPTTYSYSFLVILIDWTL